MRWSETSPYEALDLQPPVSVYAPSPRDMPATLPPLHYPDRVEVRYVRANGGIRWNSDWAPADVKAAIAWTRSIMK